MVGQRLNAVFEVRQQFRDLEAERAGEHRKYLNRQVSSAVLRRSNVRPVDPATIRELLLRPLPRLLEFLNLIRCPIAS